MTGWRWIASDAGGHDGSLGEQENWFDHRHPGGVDPRRDLIVECLLV